MALLSGGATLQDSVTVDEVAHIGAGLSYLQKLGLRMNLKHPPLAKVSDFGMGIPQLCAYLVCGRWNSNKPVLEARNVNEENRRPIDVGRRVVVSLRRHPGSQFSLSRARL